MSQLDEAGFHSLGLQVLSRLPASDVGQVVLVTSARPGEGKTVVSRRLARALATQCVGPVAWVDAASTQPGSGPGWSELLQGQALPAGTGSAAAPADAPSPDGLVVLGAGARPALQRLFQPHGVQQALATLRQRHAMTVIDGGALAACGALLQAVDGVLLVVDAGDTRREVVQGALQAHGVAPQRMLGVVLNRRPSYVPAWFYRRAL